MLSDGLACFRFVATAGCSHQASVTGGKHSNQLPQFRWIKTLLGNLKTSPNETLHSFDFDKYARRYLGGFCIRFNRRFAIAEMAARIANAVCCFMPCTERDFRVAEVYWQSRDTITENGSGEGAECRFNQASSGAEDGARLLSQARGAVGLRSSWIEKNGSTPEVLRVNPLGQLHQA